MKRAVLFLLLIAVEAGAEEPLHELIDRMVQPVLPVQSVCSDQEFVRRVFLDLTGMPPSADQVRAFVNEEAADKRRRLVQRLAASPQFDRHLTTTLDLMLMERRRNQHVPQAQWHAWLHDQVRSRRPWNEIVRDILTADGAEGPDRPAARFYLDRESEPHLITRDIGRIFLGRDYQCAQCHDHPNIDDYRQIDYHGLHAFVAPGYAVVTKVKQKEGDTEKTIDRTVYAEHAGSDLTFESVFFKGTTRRTGPRLPDGVSVPEPFHYPGDEYSVAPGEGVLSVPRHSRRRLMAELITSPDNRMFRENIANRLWAMMFGRGLVHPLDRHHFDNPPVHPELLEKLGQRIAAMQFDLRAFLSEIALSQAYQRPYDRPEDLFAAASAVTDAAVILAEQTAQQQAAVDAAEDSFSTALEAWEAAQETLLPVAAKHDEAKKTYAAARKTAAEAAAAAEKKRTELAAQEKALSALSAALTATETALSHLPDDAGLQASAAVFEKRKKELSSRIPALQKELSDLQVAADSAQTQLSEQTEKLDAVREERAGPETALRAAETELATRRRTLQHLRTTLTAQRRHLDRLQEIAQFPKLQSEAVRTVAVVEDMESRLAELRQQMQEQEILVADRRMAVTNGAQPIAEAAAAVEQARRILEERQKPVAALRRAIEATGDAAAVIPDDPILTSVGDRLTERMAPLQQAHEQAASAVREAESLLAARKSEQQQAAAALQQALAEQNRHQQALQQLLKDLEQARQSAYEASQAVAAAMAQITDGLASTAALAGLKPLTPEQMGWSVMKVTGVYDREWKKHALQHAPEQPSTEGQKQDASVEADRLRQAEQETYDALKGHIAHFVRVYAAAAGQPQDDFFATADQALFVANAGLVNGWIAPTEDNVTARIIRSESSQAAAEELYLSVLGRYPSPEEVTETGRVLESRAEDRAAAAQELVWGLLTSMEFRFNH